MEDRKILISKTGDRNFIQKILAVGHAFDINKGGLFDARSGCVNFWASPEDKPTCWHSEITKGGLNFPRDYVGAVYWEWAEDKVSFYLEATPYAMIIEGRPGKKYRTERTLTDTEWEQIFNWLENKANELFRLAELNPAYGGTKCPFCSYILQPNRIMNELLEHISNHEDVIVTGVVIGNPVVLQTNKGKFNLEEVDEWNK